MEYFTILYSSQEQLMGFSFLQKYNKGPYRYP